MLRELKFALRLLNKFYLKADVSDRKWMRDDWIEFFDLETDFQNQYASIRRLYSSKPMEEMKGLISAIESEIDVYRNGSPQSDDLSDSGSADSEPHDPGSPSKRLKLAEDDDRSTKKGDILERQPRTTRRTRIVLRTKTNTNHRPLLCKGVDESDQTPRILPDDASTRSNAGVFANNAGTFLSNTWAFSNNAMPSANAGTWSKVVRAFSNNAQAKKNSDQEEHQDSRRPRGLVTLILEKVQKSTGMDQPMKDT
ncbi:Ff.00g058760.m01.CDS01 [Fusarium sp. VM40]|nr:Ff.00g058760.m01.CDS01 [Fusarium sp. VM40]